MIKLNILAREQKKNLKLRHLHHVLKNIDFVLILIGVTIALMLLFSRIIMQDTFNNIVAQTTLITRNSQSYNNRVRSVNSEINAVDQIQKDFLDWHKIFSELSSITENDITFTYIRMAADDKTLRLRGHAGTRDGLLHLKAAMEDSELFNKIDFPLTNILEQKDINFEMSAVINLNKIR